MPSVLGSRGALSAFEVSLAFPFLKASYPPEGGGLVEICKERLCVVRVQCYIIFCIWGLCESLGFVSILPFTIKKTLYQGDPLGKEDNTVY